MENLIERLVLMAKGNTITREDIPPEFKVKIGEIPYHPQEKQAGQFKDFIRSPRRKKWRNK